MLLFLLLVISIFLCGVIMKKIIYITKYYKVRVDKNRVELASLEVRYAPCTVKKELVLYLF